MSGGQGRSNREMFLPYAAPYFAYVLVAAIPPDLVGRGANYGLRIALVGTLLAAFWKRYPKFTGPYNPAASVAIGVAAGGAAGALWVVMAGPLAPPGGVPFAGWEVAVRMCATVLLVPVFEELFLRRYVLAVAHAWSVLRADGKPEPLQRALDSSSADELEPGTGGLVAAAVSTAAFTLGHRPFEWSAAVVFSFAMLLLWRTRRDMVSLFAAHGAANMILGFYVAGTGAWNLW